MVFSFFKKAPEKMVARPAAVPRSTKIPDPLPVPEAGKAEAAESPPPTGPSSEPAHDAASPPDSTDFVFSESSPDFQIEGEIDPVDAQAEEAAILFANGQDEAVRGTLENAVRLHRVGPGERLWLMLFDIYQLSGKKAPFEALEIEYAQSFEKSPPGWRDKSGAQPKARELAIASLLFKGDLSGDNDAAFADIQHSLQRNPRLRLDLSKLGGVDAPGCARLLSLWQQARKARQEFDLVGRDRLSALLEECIAPGRADNRECWLLFLELCQLQGRYEVFEEAAINYAVTFEVSPPSWEPRIVAPEAAPAKAAAGQGADLDAYALHGDIKASRFGDLRAHAEAHDPVLIDCAQLTRIDFISAGALLNVLTTVRRSGKQIVFRHPNHLVAELFGIVGLKAVATIVPEKY